MKHFNRFQILISLLLCTTLAGTTGCSKEEGNSGQGGGDEQKEVFNFSTRSTYTLNVEYTVPSGYEVYFEVYAENPLVDNNRGELVKRTDIQPIDKGYTDGKGLYKKPIVINSAVEQLYIYTPYIGVPRLLTCKVENGILTAAAPDRATETTQKSSRAPSDYVWDNKTNFPERTTLTLGKWGHSTSPQSFPTRLSDIWTDKANLYGRPDYMYAVRQDAFPGQGKKPALKFSADIFKTIRAALPGDNNGAVNPDILRNGAINVTQQAEIEFYYVAPGGAYQNVLAYYCYPTGQAPTTPSQIKAQVIALPNATNIDYHIDDYWTAYGAVFPGEGIRLHYIDENGVDQGEIFPAGVSIGWILYSNGYKTRSTSVDGTWGEPSVGLGAVYSDPKLMQNETPHMAVFRHGDFVVTAFEDCIQTSTPNCDYDDVIFHVASTPAEAIIPGIPDKDPNPAPAPDIDVDYRGILSFEDNWPYRGDFDMNDVVVKYSSKVILNNKNQVTETVDTYTIMWSGAKFNNSFAIENKNISLGNGTVTFEGGDGTAVIDGNIIRAANSVLDYANQSEKKTLTVTTKFANPISKESFIYPPYNPFITVNSDKGREVHLTNVAPTSYNDSKWLGFGHDFSKPEAGLYYITYNEAGIQMPFAIDIMFNSEDDMASYQIPLAEVKSINEYYPDFMKWLQSNGKTNKDWYLYPKQ